MQMHDRAHTDTTFHGPSTAGNDSPRPSRRRGISTLLAIGAAATSMLAATVVGGLYPSAAHAAATSRPQLAAARSRARPRSVWSPVQRRRIMARTSHGLGGQVATWYGPGFFGHRTACGGTLQAGTWGVAHRTLPCGTMVLLSWHGTTVAVPVIDRGPFSGASFDLTSQVARHLGFDRVGSGRVGVDVLTTRVNAAASTRVTGGSPPQIELVRKHAAR